MSGSTPAYSWASNAHFRASAEDVASVINRIRSENGGLCTPHELVGEAQSQTSPLHNDIYSLGDDEAAYQHRLTIARAMIRGIRVINSPSEIAFVHIQVTNGSETEGYVTSEDAMENESYRQSVLKQGKQTLLAAKLRYGWLSELDPIWEAIDKILGKED